MIPADLVQIQSRVALTGGAMRTVKYFRLMMHERGRTHVLFLAELGSECSTTYFVSDLAKVALANLAPLKCDVITFWEATHPDDIDLEFRRITFTWCKGVPSNPVWWLPKDIPDGLRRAAQAVVREERENQQEVGRRL